jgi:flagellar capping protein FliD
VDAKALEAAFNTNPSAVTQALGNVGRAAEATTTRQLSSTGSVGASLSNLNNRVQQLETRQSDVQTRAEQSQRAVESVTRRYGFGAVGAGAYLGIFGL